MLLGALLAAFFTAGPVAAAPAQVTARVIVDDPSNALGSDRRAVVRRAATALRGRGRSGRRATVVVSVVPALRGRRVSEVVADRFAANSKRASAFDLMLLLALEERRAVLTVRDVRAVARELRASVDEVRGTLTPASRAGTRRFRSGDAGAAALTTIRTFDEGPARKRRGKDDDPDPVDWLVWLIPLLVVGTVRELAAGLRAHRRARALWAGAKPVGAVEDGLATVSGVVIGSPPIESPPTGKSCVYWKLVMSESWEERGGWADSQGRMEHTVRVNSGHEEYGPIEESAPFYVRDATGEVLVDPAKARVVAKRGFHKSVDRSRPEYCAHVVPEHRYSTGRRYVEEWIIEVNDQVTVVGTVTTAGGSSPGEPVRQIGASRSAPFVITVKKPRGAALTEWRGMTRHLAWALALVGGIVAILMVID